MGEIRLDKRGKDDVLSFRVGIGKKRLILRSVVIPKGDLDAMRAEIAEGLRVLRPAQPPSGVVQ